MRSIPALVCAVLLALAPTPAAAEAWTRAWTSSLWQGNERQVIAVENQTLRTQIRVGAGGPAIRLWLANDFGSQPVRIGRVTIRKSDGRSAAVSFAGKPSARIAVGAPAVSDPVQLAVKPFDLIEISVHLPEPTTLVGVHVDRANMLRISPHGDFTSAQFEAVKTDELRPLVAGVDVQGPKSRPVVVAFGDSITDATSCPNSDSEPCRWSEVLGRRLRAAGSRMSSSTRGSAATRSSRRSPGPTRSLGSTATCSPFPA